MSCDRLPGELSPREKFRAFMRHQEESRILQGGKPRVVAMGFDDYDRLKAEVLASVAEVVPVGPSFRHMDLMAELNRSAVECFFYGDNLIIRIASSAVCGPFVLNSHE